MRLSEESIERMASMLFAADAERAFGSSGVAGLGRLLNGIRDFFVVIPPEALSTSFVFVHEVQGLASDAAEERMVPFAASLDREALSGYRQRVEAAAVLVVFVEEDGRFALGEAAEMPALKPLSERALVFVNEDGADQFIIQGCSTEMPRLVIGARSNFAVPTVSDLEEALASYRRDVSHVSCPLLADLWVGGRNGPRLVFLNRPEAKMRRSLERYLSTRIIGSCVRPEHNTDETRPVDLAVSWFGAKQRALIEIKWLGKALRKDSTSAPFTEYGPARAQEGADQLAEYLDRERSTDPDVTLRGYLTVFDGRRRGVTHPCTAIASADACYFRDRDIFLTRDYSERGDVAPLVRFFLEPRRA